MKNYTYILSIIILFGIADYAEAEAGERGEQIRNGSNRRRTVSAPMVIQTTTQSATPPAPVIGNEQMQQAQTTAYLLGLASLPQVTVDALAAQFRMAEANEQWQNLIKNSRQGGLMGTRESRAKLRAYSEAHAKRADISSSFRTLLANDSEAANLYTRLKIINRVNKVGEIDIKNRPKFLRITQQLEKKRLALVAQQARLPASTLPALKDIVSTLPDAADVSAALPAIQDILPTTIPKEKVQMCLGLYQQIKTDDKVLAALYQKIETDPVLRGLYQQLLTDLSRDLPPTAGLTSADGSL